MIAQVELGRVVVDVDRLSVAAAGLDLDEALREKTTDTADEALSLTQDDRVGAQFLSDLRQDLLERPSSVGPHTGADWTLLSVAIA